MMNIRLIKYEQIFVGVQCESWSSLAESAISKYIGLGMTADPAGSNSIWQMCQSM